MADASTATEPEAIPMISFTNTSTVATELETMVAFFCGDICFFKKDPVGWDYEDYNMRRLKEARVGWVYPPLKYIAFKNI